MGYTATTGVSIYWNPNKIFFIHRCHNDWFDEYNYCLSIEDQQNTGSLIFQQDPENIIHNSDLLNLIPRKMDITSTPFCDTKFITYEIELPPAVNKIGFNLLDG